MTIRPSTPDDVPVLVAGRDEVFHRFLGDGDPAPHPVACIVVDDEVVGWVDYDVEHDWLKQGEVNVGYYLFPTARGEGYASRAVELLLVHLDRETEHTAATLLIDRENERSLRLANRLGFEPRGEVQGELFFVRELGPWSAPGSSR